MTTTWDSRAAPLLLERDRELAALRNSLGAAARGSGSLVIVEGPAGLGKTSLLAELARMAEHMGFLARQARGSEMERDMPYGVVRQWFESLIERASDEQSAAWLSGSARRALRALGRTDAQEDGSADDPFGPINGLYWLVANLADSDPVLLAVDDAHWSDVESLRYLAFLSRRVRDMSVLVALGARTGEPDEPPELQGLRLDARRLRVSPLSGASIRDLIANRAGRTPSTRFSEACADMCSGNPFLVTELLRELRSEGLEPDDTAADLVADMAPDAVADAVLARLGRFGPDAVALAKAVAVFGGTAQPRHIAQMTGINDERVALFEDHVTSVVHGDFPDGRSRRPRR